MLLSLSLIILLGVTIGNLFVKLKLPHIIGMLITGIILGPHVLNLLDSSILKISADLRKMALVIILLKAGLSLDLSDLKKSGSSAFFLSFLPASFEILGYIIFAPIFFKVKVIDAAVLGAVLASVSPAVVVPRMIDLIERKYGTNKGIPQMIVAGASCDDIFTIVLFTTFLNTALNGHFNINSLFSIPISIILGIIIGSTVGYFLHIIFENLYKKHHYVRNSIKVIIILGFSFLLVSLEEKLSNILPISGLLAVMSMASVIKIKSVDFVSKRLSEKFGKIWLSAEVLLFVLVGAAVDIRYTLGFGKEAILIIFICLIFRSVGILISIAKRDFNNKERVFCILAYIPKATVQAAIASIPLLSGLGSGNLILSIAVLSILITAPMGAIGIDKTYVKYLKKSNN